MPQTPEERIEEIVEYFDHVTYPPLAGNPLQIRTDEDLLDIHSKNVEYFRQALTATHNNAIQMAMGKVPKEEDEENIEVPQGENIGEYRHVKKLERRGHNTAITQMNKGLSELIIE
jgi:hypothetical protein